jgi:hypothetical protein
MLALPTVLLGASIAWFARPGVDPVHPVSPASAIEARLPPEAALSAGETLEERSPASETPGVRDNPVTSPIAMTSPAATEKSASTTSVGVPGTVRAASEGTVVPDIEPAAPVKGAGRRTTASVQGSGRTADPRTGCEHLFFAFAARCEANHCQQPAYARHPRCEAVREQNRRDEARRNSMPIS